MLLSQRCEYGLRAALHLTASAPGAYVPIREVSAALGIPYHFLAKIAQSLIQEGVLESTRGPGGGVRLARPSGQVTLHEIVLALDGPAIFEACVLGLPGCGVEQPCPLHDRLAPARDRVRAMFEETTLAGLADRIRSSDVRLADLTR